MREGRFTALLAGQGLVTIPSFHVVFAVLFTWVFRHERFIHPVAITLNLGVIAVTFPIGWHYLADLPGGMIWMAATIVVVRRIQGAAPTYAAVERSTLPPLQGVIRGGGSSFKGSRWPKGPDGQAALPSETAPDQFDHLPTERRRA